MDLQSNSYQKISTKWTIIRRTVVRQTLFSCPKMNFLPKNNLYKPDRGTKTILILFLYLCPVFYFFTSALFFTVICSLVYILINFFQSIFCSLNDFGCSKKFKIYRDLKPETSTMIHTFSNYSTFYCTVTKR